MSIDVNIGGAQKRATEVHVNIGGVWKKASNVSVNIGGVWKDGGLEKMIQYVQKTSLGGTTHDGTFAITFADNAIFTGGDQSYSSGIQSYNSSLLKTVMPDLDEPSRRPNGAVIGNYLLIAGGIVSATTLKITVYNTNLTKATPIASGMRDCYPLVTATNPNYAIFVSGDDENNESFAYNKSLVRSSASLSSGRSSSCGVSVGDYAIFAGGRDSSVTNKVDAFNSSLVRTLPTALSNIREAAKGANAGVYALIMGGHSWSTDNTTVPSDAYNASLVRYTAPSVLSNYIYHSAVSIADNAFVMGGATGTYNLIFDKNLIRTQTVGMGVPQAIIESTATTGSYILGNSTSAAYTSNYDVFVFKYD